MTIQAGYYHPEIRKHVDNFQCHCCQCVKIPLQRNVLAKQNVINTPWYEDANSLIGQWSTKTEYFNGEFYAFICINITLNLVELVCIDTKSSDAFARKFETTC